MLGFRLLLVLLAAVILPVESQTTSSGITKKTKEPTTQEIEKSCPVTKRFSDDFASCKKSWSVFGETGERVGENSTCITRRDDVTQKFKCVDGKWTSVAVPLRRKKRLSCPGDIVAVALPGETCAVVTWNEPGGVDSREGLSSGECISVGAHRIKLVDRSWFTWFGWFDEDCSFTVTVYLRCPDLGSISNGRRSCTGGPAGDFSQSSVCTHSCNSGFRLDGFPSTRCDSAGSSMVWTNQVSYCRGQCQPLPNHNNGVRTCSDGNYEDSTCTHTCNGGYDISEPDSIRCRKSGTSTYYWDTTPECRELCAWQTSHCWPGDCSQQLASNCVCRAGFRAVTVNGRRLCEMNTPPNLSTCRVSVTDSQGNTKNSSTTGTSTNCDSQQDAWISTQPTELYFAIKADLNMNIGTRLQYVSDSRVGVVGATLTLVKVSISGSESTVLQMALSGNPHCHTSTSSTQPLIGGAVHDCAGTVTIPTVNLQDTERLCADMEARSGGFYNLQEANTRPQGQYTFQTVSKKKRVCFLFDGSKPTHCSSSTPACGSQPLQLSTRLTRQPRVTVHIEGWLDPYPPGKRPQDVSQIANYKLELHEVDVEKSSLVVKDSDLHNHSAEWPATDNSADVTMTLPDQFTSRLYAVLLEVHDHAGNVGYARRLVLYDNSSSVKLNTSAALRVTTADARANFEWQTNIYRGLCVSWKDRFHNSEMIHNNFLLPVLSDMAREIIGNYDQISGLLSVRGTDTVNGVVTFEMSWKLDEGAASPYAVVQNLQSQSSCLSVNLADGQTYNIIVRATDIMGNYKEDDVQVSIDHTGPSVSVVGLRGRFGRDGLYVHNSTDLSTMVVVVQASDPHSGIHTVTWALGTSDGVSDVGSGAMVVQRRNKTECAKHEHCYCPAVGQCEVYEYTIIFNRLSHTNSRGQHHRQYYLAVNVTNQAALRDTQHIEILVDESPPTSGVVLEGQRGDNQAEMDFTSSDVVYVRWHGFQDHESGIVQYRVALAERCLSTQEMEGARDVNVTEVEEGNTAILKFPHEGRYFVSVVAYNGAMEPSTAACSDGIKYDTTPPALLNVSVTQARIGRSIACTHPNQSWLINSNMTRTRLSQVERCLQRCSNRQPVSAKYLTVASNISLGDAVSTDLCMRLPEMTEDDFTVLPSDYLRLSWVGYDEESQMEEYYVGIGGDRTTADAPDLMAFTPTHGHSSYHVLHSGLGHGDLFYIFLRAVSKAGLDAHLTLGPIIIDVTPPEVTQPLTAVVEEGFVVVKWSREMFKDAEQPDGMDLEVTYRLGFTDHFVTPFLTMPESALAHCKNSIVAGCARYPISALQAYDTESGRSFFFQLHVINAAGHVTTVNTSSVRLPAHSPPSHATVMDVIRLRKTSTLDPPTSETEAPTSLTSPVWERTSTTAYSDTVTTSLPSTTPAEETAPEYSKDVDVVMERNEICIAWYGFYRADEVTVEVGVGTTNKTDDVVAFLAIGDKRSPVCVNSSSLPVYSKLFSLVRASDTGGTTVVASDGFTLIPTHDPSNRLVTFNGKGCARSDQIGSTLISRDSTVMLKRVSRVPIHIGDMLFVRFTPFVSDVTFPEAILTKTTLHGYQIAVKSTNVTAVLPLKVAETTNVEILNCVKDTLLLTSTEGHMTVTWEISGPWSNLVKNVRVEVTDETCLETTVKKDKYKELECLVAEKYVSSSLQKLDIHTESIFPGHAYTLSVAACFDDGCAHAGQSDPVIFDDSERSVAFDLAVIIAQSSDEVQAEFNASIPPLPATFTSPYNRSCLFMWTVAADEDGATPVTDFRVARARDCSNLQVKETLQAVRNKGTLYACVQFLFPWRPRDPSCHKLTHLTPQQAEPFNVIELILSTLQHTDFDRYLYSRHLGSNFRYLLDLDLDFAESSDVLSAIVTNGGNRTVQWFLMEGKQRAPEDGDCASDADCVLTRTSSDGKAIFPGDQSHLQDGHVYYICAFVSPATSGILQGGHESGVDVCGDGVVIDDTLPAAGSVTIHNAETGFLANTGGLLVTWSGFTDVETSQLTLGGATLNYSVALGKYEGAEDIAHFVSVGRRTAWTFTHLNVSAGTVCVATVKAEDRVGHVTQAYSQPIIIDSTPPSVGLLVVGAITQPRFVSGQELIVRWEDVEDMESGVVLVEVGILSETGQEVIPFKICEDNAVLISSTSLLVDGHPYVALLKATNGAGMVTVTQSALFIVDSSPPGQGKVFNSASNTSDHKAYSADVGVYRVYWSGFADPHSGLDYYRVGLGTQPEQTDIESFVYAGRQNSFTWRRNFQQGRQYYATVEACNKAGLCRLATTGSITFDNSPPVAGTVTVGLDGRHSRFLGHNSSLPVEWTGFSDPQSGIHDFSWCVGRTPATCDVVPSTQTLLSLAAVKAGLTLPVATPLFVTVRARNPLGMAAVGVSDSFIVDPTPPEVVTTPYFVNPQDEVPTRNQWDRSVLRFIWAFRDPGSSVVSYTVSIRSQLTGRLVADPSTVTAKTGITLLLDENHLLTDGDRHWATVTACNAAGLCTTLTSNTLLIDSTPPTVGTLQSPLNWVKRGSSGTLATHVSVAWRGFVDVESGVVRYFLSAGRNYTGDELSGGQILAQHDNNTHTQLATLQIKENVAPGEVVYINVWAENSVGLRSAVSRMEFKVLTDNAAGTSGSLVSVRHSCRAAYCTGECTCAAAGQVCQDQRTECRDVQPSDPSLQGWNIVSYIGGSSGPHEYTASTKCLEGHWRLTNPQLMSSVSRVEVSFGLAIASYDEGLVFSAEGNAVWHEVVGSNVASWDPRATTASPDGVVSRRSQDGNMTAVYCLSGERVLHTGFRYVMHVRVWLSRDQRMTFTSDPITVDHTAPRIARAGAVLESTADCSRDLEYVTTEADFTACWGSVFREQESRITQYDVWVGTAPQADDIIKPTNVGLKTTFIIPTAGLEEGTRYYVTVRAVNSVGLIATATSDGITIDFTPPVAGVVFTSDDHTNREAQSAIERVTASWHGFQDRESGVTSYRAAVYDVGEPATPVLPFTDVGFSNTYTFTGLRVLDRHSYQIKVKAVDAAGLESVIVTSSPILVDTTPPEGITCSQYTLLDTQPMTYTRTDSFLFDTYHSEFRIAHPVRDELTRVLVTATGLQPGAEGHVSVEQLKMPLHFKYTKAGNAAAEHVLLLPETDSSQNVTLSVVVEADPGAILSAKVYRCSESVVSENDAVTVHQISEFAVSVCARVRDQESQIRTMQVGIGTTPGGLQVQPLTPGGHSGHAVVEMTVQHIMPLYATVIAENHAGLQSRFISRPVTVDRTPPFISVVKVTPRFEDQDRVNATDVWVDAEWTAVDGESGGVVCLCHLEGQSTYDSNTHEISQVTPGHCQWRLMQPHHGATIRVVVSCVNGVQIHATVMSEPVDILLHPPDITATVIQSLSNDVLMSPYDGPDPVVRSTNSRLQFCWHGADDPTISRFEHRFLYELSPLGEWFPLDAYKTSAVLEHAASQLPHGVITAQVRAVNFRNMTSDVVSAAVRVDGGSPVLTGQAATANVFNKQLHLNWHNVFHVTRDVTYAMYAGTAEGYGDIVNHVITKGTSFTGQWKKETLSSVFVTIQAVYSNGYSNVYQAKLSL